MRIERIRNLILLLLITFCPQIEAQDLLFDSSEILKIELETDIKTLLKDVGENQKYHPAVISFENKDKEFVKYPLKVQTRGNFRRQRKNCSFPPLRLRFNPEIMHETVFEGQKKLKLVTHCRNRNAIYEENILIEYLIYKLYEETSNVSYRTRLVELTYIDAKQKREDLTRLAFIIESKSKLEKRIGKKELEVGSYDPHSINMQMSADIFLFQFMIANTDWSLSNMHNIVLFADMSTDPPKPLTYDFDWSGIISAPYAQPAEKLGIDNIRTRLYRGYCIPETYIEQSRQKFLSLKDRYQQIISEQTKLSENKRDEVWEFIEEFYTILNNEKMFKREVLDKCRKYGN